MKHYESLIIGHITMDHDTDYLGNETLAIGGAVIYSSASAYALGHKVAALTKIYPDDSERLTYFTIPKEDIYCIMSESSCTMDNQYFTADKERRKCMCISVGTPFTIDDIPENVEADIYHFAGLLYGDFTNEMIIEASKRGKVAVDVQALLRHVNLENHTMFFEDWKEKKEVLPYIEYLKTDAAEAEILTGLTDRYEAAKLLHTWGAKEVVITHNTEVIAFALQYPGYTVGIPELGSTDTIAPAVSKGNTTVLDWINEEIKALGEENFFHADYEATLADTYGSDYEDTLVVEGGETK